MATQQEIAHQIECAHIQYNAHQDHVTPVEGCMWCEEQAEYDARSVFDGEDEPEAA